MKFLNRKQSFTLMELMVVVTIVGIIAAFAIPNYSKSVERSREKQMTNNLLILHSALKSYKAYNNDIYPAGNLNLTALNSLLGLNIIPVSGEIYEYYEFYNLTDFHSVRVTSPQGWKLHFHDSHNYIHCSPGTPCPTCPDESVPGGCGFITW